jgi:ribosomal protein S18 acetylase RimI-like enzyme
MDRFRDEGQLSINFREIRLPRPITVEYPRVPEKMAENWETRTAFLVGILEDEPVGYICLADGMSPSTAWVTDLAVHPACRRQGIASALVLAAAEWAAQQKNRRMVMEMQSKNLAAIRLAQKLGYDFCGYNDHYYENQDIALFFSQFLR